MDKQFHEIAKISNYVGLIPMGANIIPDSWIEAANRDPSNSFRVNVEFEFPFCNSAKVFVV